MNAIITYNAFLKDRTSTKYLQLPEQRELETVEDTGIFQDLVRALDHDCHIDTRTQRVSKLKRFNSTVSSGFSRDLECSLILGRDK